MGEWGRRAKAGTFGAIVEGETEGGPASDWLAPHQGRRARAFGDFAPEFEKPSGHAHHGKVEMERSRLAPTRL